MLQRQCYRSRCSTRGGRLPGSRRRQRSGRSGTGSPGEWEGKLESINRRSTRAARRLESLEEAETKWKRRGRRQQNRARLPKKSNCSADIQGPQVRETKRLHPCARHRTTTSNDQQRGGRIRRTENPCANKQKDTHVLYSIPVFLYQTSIISLIIYVTQFSSVNRLR